MADLTIGSIALTSSRARPTTALAGETIAIGDLVYLDSATSTYMKADASAAASAEVAGIAVTGGALNEYILIQSNESLDIGATMVKGTPYYLSATAGKICPHGDLVSTNVVTLIGHASSTSALDLSITKTGIVI